MAKIATLKGPGQATANPEQPLVAVVLPVFKHSVLVTEAIRSALAQKTDFPFKLLVVNDGCPFQETHETLLAQAEAAADRLIYLRRANGGLSAARNTGIDYAMTALPSVEAIYFLDADNRLYPHALQRAWDQLQANPACGWAYPDIDMFGVAINARAPADYSVLKHLAENICEAGSMVRRSLFERGLRFDESMKLGFEDWDFWLQAIGQGYAGTRVDTMGFRYRKRPESMLSESERDRAEILAYMRRKHKKLYSRQSVLAAEHQEAPRFAIHLADRNEVLLATDPTAAAPRLPWGDFTGRFLGAWADPDREHCPNYLVFTSEAALAQLADLRLLHWCLWRLEDALDGEACFAALTIERGDRPDARVVRESAPDEPLGLLRRADLVMTTRRILQECVADTGTGWLCSLADPAPEPPVFEMTVTAGQVSDGTARRRPLAGGSVAHLLRTFFELRHHVQGAPPPMAAEWRKVETVAQSDLHLTARDVLKARPLFPRLRGEASERNVGFVLPLVSFGGVEKVAINLARSLRQQGWQPHLFVFAAPGVDNLAELSETFATINFLADPLAEQYDPTTRYFGTEFSAWANGGDHARALGLLAGMDAVINGHSTDAHAIMGALKRAGMVTVNHLHLVDRGPHGEPTGSPYRAVAYEHAFDAILVISQRLYDWCRAMGIPDGKLLLARNAPSFAPPADEVATILEDRRRRAAGPLRVAFIARFDRQKGIERLGALIGAVQAKGLPVEWRIVGGAVLIEGEAQQLAEAIEPFRYPPARSPSELTEHLAWADVILQPSHFEGVPLMLLEAMQLGVVPLATDVGAVREIVQSGTTGFLVENGPDPTVVAAMLERLAALAADRPRLLSLAEAAVKATARHGWGRTAALVSARLEDLRRAKMGERPQTDAGAAPSSQGVAPNIRSAGR